MEGRSDKDWKYCDNGMIINNQLLYIGDNGDIVCFKHNNHIYILLLYVL